MLSISSLPYPPNVLLPALPNSALLIPHPLFYCFLSLRFHTPLSPPFVDFPSETCLVDHPPPSLFFSFYCFAFRTRRPSRFSRRHQQTSGEYHRRVPRPQNTSCSSYVRNPECLSLSFCIVSLSLSLSFCLVFPQFCFSACLSSYLLILQAVGVFFFSVGRDEWIVSPEFSLDGWAAAAAADFFCFHCRYRYMPARQLFFVQRSGCTGYEPIEAMCVCVWFGKPRRNRTSTAGSPFFLGTHSFEAAESWRIQKESRPPKKAPCNFTYTAVFCTNVEMVEYSTVGACVVHRCTTPPCLVEIGVLLFHRRREGRVCRFVPVLFISPKVRCSLRTGREREFYQCAEHV